MIGDPDTANDGTAGARKVGYAHDRSYTELADLLPSNAGRATVVEDLIRTHHLLERCDRIPPSLASKAQLTAFHDAGFISYLLNEQAAPASDTDGSDADASTETDDRKLQKRYGLEFDCPPFDGLDKYVRAVAGTTIACAQYIASVHKADKAVQPVAVNWHGGRHHAAKDRCSGFCYVNDIVLGILELRKTFEKVMYIDLDLHHGDGVETSFAHSNKVLNLSIHRFDKGFFPGSGSINFTGKARGQNYTINLGLRHGLSDGSLRTLVEQVVRPAFCKFAPDAVVLQCGADGLARDPTKEWNLTVKGLAAVILGIVDWRVPTLLLGGGGYNHADAARLWCSVLGRLVVGDEVDTWDLIPHESQCIDQYADDGYLYFADDARPIEDLNLKSGFMDRVVDHAKAQIAKIGS